MVAAAHPVCFTELCSMSDASSIRILSAGAPKSGVRLSAEAWSAKTGRTFAVEFATAPAIRERVGAGSADADIVVAPLPAMEGFVAAGRIVDGSLIALGEIAAGVVVRNGAIEPDLSSVETFRSALLDADALVYNQASSGEYIATMIDKLGIADQVAGKTVRVANGAAVMEHLAADTRDRIIGFGQVTEIRLHEDIGVHLVGPLPAEFGKVTAYAAGLSASVADKDAAALLAFIASDAGKAIFAATGVA
jgi:molybdate transport system substrate-binding protein